MQQELIEAVETIEKDERAEIVFSNIKIYLENNKLQPEELQEVIEYVKKNKYRTTISTNRFLDIVLKKLTDIQDAKLAQLYQILGSPPSSEDPMHKTEFRCNTGGGKRVIRGTKSFT